MHCPCPLRPALGSALNSSEASGAIHKKPQRCLQPWSRRGCREANYGRLMKVPDVWSFAIGINHSASVQVRASSRRTRGGATSSGVAPLAGREGAVISPAGPALTGLSRRRAADRHCILRVHGARETVTMSSFTAKAVDTGEDLKLEDKHQAVAGWGRAYVTDNDQITPDRIRYRRRSTEGPDSDVDDGPAHAAVRAGGLFRDGGLPIPGRLLWPWAAPLQKLCHAQQRRF